MNALLIPKSRLHIEGKAQLLASFSLIGVVLTGLIVFDSRLALISRILSCGILWWLVFLSLGYLYRTRQTICIPVFQVAVGLALSGLVVSVGTFGYASTGYFATSSSTHSGQTFIIKKALDMPEVGYLMDGRQNQQSSKREDASGVGHTSYENPRPKNALLRKRKLVADEIEAAR
jgi:hypothetical protein